jgi:hypothetical protein
MNAPDITTTGASDVTQSKTEEGMTDLDSARRP